MKAADEMINDIQAALGNTCTWPEAARVWHALWKRGQCVWCDRNGYSLPEGLDLQAAADKILSKP
jgi:hypothetical protein